jgi:electron transport complex protein RnfB
VILEDVYRKLAQRLDAIPNGFPTTESGVELRLLAKIFTSEEATLASSMRLTLESATDIATRAGVEPDIAYRTLRGMVRKRLIRTKKSKGQLIFGLMPFVVGIYEEQLPRIDTELAELFEQYYQETKGGFFCNEPSVHRIIPIEKVIPFDLEIFPYEKASVMLEEAKSWGVRDCICRVQQRLVGKGCDNPVENCLFFAPFEGAFSRGGVTRQITKEESLCILREAEEAGLLHSTANYRDGLFYICNCCICCCGVMRGVAEFGNPNAVARSDFRAAVNPDVCAGCGDCVERCQFGALSVSEVFCVVNYNRCVGCGLCASVCPTGALYVERRPETEASPLPDDIKEWMLCRAQERNISISYIQ